MYTLNSRRYLLFSFCYSSALKTKADRLVSPVKNLATPSGAALLTLRARNRTTYKRLFFFFSISLVRPLLQLFLSPSTLALV